MSCGAGTLGQGSQGKAALGFSPNSDVPDHTPHTPCSPKQPYYALVRTIAYCPGISPEGLPAQLQSSKAASIARWFLLLKREKIIFSIWLFQPWLSHFHFSQVSHSPLPSTAQQTLLYRGAFSLLCAVRSPHTLPAPRAWLQDI